MLDKRVMSSTVRTDFDVPLIDQPALDRGEALVELHEHRDAGGADEGDAREVQTEPVVSLAHRLGEPGIEVVCPVAIEPTRDRQLHAPVDGVARNLHVRWSRSLALLPDDFRGVFDDGARDDEADVPRGVQIHDDPRARHGLEGD